MFTLAQALVSKELSDQERTRCSFFNEILIWGIIASKVVWRPLPSSDMAPPFLKKKLFLFIYFERETEPKLGRGREERQNPT